MVSALEMPEESLYVKLGDVEPVNLMQFAHQIASGMVRPHFLLSSVSYTYAQSHIHTQSHTHTHTQTTLSHTHTLIDYTQSHTHIHYTHVHEGSSMCRLILGFRCSLIWTLHPLSPSMFRQLW